MRRLQPVDGQGPLVISDAVDRIDKLQRAVETVIKGNPRPFVWPLLP